MIDIIIPAYNAFETIDKTLNSISKQINRNSLHTYIINDGSTKSYKDIIDKYRNILNITEITIENSGPGKARQVGLDASNNEYIVFLDADDILYNEYSLIKLINIIQDNDLAQGYFIEKNETEFKITEPQLFYLHGKMFRRSIIEKNNIKFDITHRKNGDIYEDSTFTQLYLLCSEKIITTQEVVYTYEYNPNSITKYNKDNAIHLQNFIEAMNWLTNEIKKRNIKNNYEIARNYQIILFHIYFHYLLLENPEKIKLNTINEIKKMYDKYIYALPYETQVSIYKTFDHPIIPKISFYDFLNKITE